MSFASLLRHRATISRRLAVTDGSGDPTYDELGQPITELLPIGTWRCRIEPLTAREVALLSQAGAVVSTHRIYGFQEDIRTGDLLTEAGDDYEVNSVPDAGGQGHHWEVIATLISSADPEPS